MTILVDILERIVFNIGISIKSLRLVKVRNDGIWTNEPSDCRLVIPSRPQGASRQRRIDDACASVRRTIRGSLIEVQSRGIQSLAGKELIRS